MHAPTGRENPSAGPSYAGHPAASVDARPVLHTRGTSTTLAHHCAAAATLAVAALLAAGCAGEVGGVVDVPPGPVEALFEAAWAQPPEGDVTAAVVRVEKLIVQCMTDAGFAYLPVDQPEAVAAPLTPPDPANGTREYAELYGYGVTADPTAAARPAPEELWVDPNAADVQAMSPAEQAEYWAALRGEPATDADDGEWQYDWRAAGCQGRAQNEVYGTDSQLADEFAALQAELEEVRLAFAADPRVAELDAAWAACMATAGYPGLARVGDAEAAVRAELAALRTEAWSTLPAEPAETDVAAVEQVARDATNRLAGREIATALADLTCRDDVAYDVEQQRITSEYQQRFYQVHQVELEAWVASSTDAAG